MTRAAVWWSRLTLAPGDLATFQGRQVRVLQRVGWWSYAIDDPEISAIDVQPWWRLDRSAQMS